MCYTRIFVPFILASCGSQQSPADSAPSSAHARAVPDEFALEEPISVTSPAPSPAERNARAAESAANGSDVRSSHPPTGWTTKPLSKLIFTVPLRTPLSS